MTNVNLLNEKIKQSGLKRSYLAERIGVSTSGFYNLCTGKAEFKVAQVKILCRELHIDDPSEWQDIFFAGNGA